MIRSVELGRAIQVLSEDELTRVHQATLDVLARTGVKVTSRGVLERLADTGARVDLNDERARFPADMVEAALRRVPRDLVMGARDPANTFVLDGSRGYLGVDGCAAEVLDLDTEEKRPSTKADLADITRMADGLDEIAYVWQPVSARDVPVPVQPLHETETGFRNTSKHLMQMTAVNSDQARAVVEMATAVAGNPERLRREPVVSAFQCSLSPLTYEAGPIEAALVYAGAGVPCGFMVMPITCATAPASIAGTLVVSNSEIVAGVVILEALAPGAPTFYGSCATSLDLRTGVATCGGPEDIYYQMAGAQLARHYGIRSIMGTFASGSKIYDWQAGVENAFSGMASVLSGADLLSGTGLLFAARMFSAAEMVLDCETFGLISAFVDGFRAEPEDLALEVIDAVGPDNHFMATPHSLPHMRDFWKSEMFERSPWGRWEAEGRPGPSDAARAKAKRILADHAVDPVPDDVSRELDNILARYTRLLVQEGD